MYLPILPHSAYQRILLLPIQRLFLCWDFLYTGTFRNELAGLRQEFLLLRRYYIRTFNTEVQHFGKATSLGVLNFRHFLGRLLIKDSMLEIC